VEIVPDGNIGSEWSILRAKSAGTAIVTVTYDAASALQYANNTGNMSTYYGGQYFGAIWPENTGVFVVSVNAPDNSMDANMRINETYNEEKMKNAGKYVDAEHDVFYYINDEEAFNYTFKPTFLNNPEIEADQTVFLLNTDGNSFNKTNAGSEAITAFRPYFLTATPAGSRGVEQIIFGQSNNQFGVDDQDPSQDDITGNLIVRAKRKMIVVESTLNYTTTVRISSTAGLTIAVFDIEPGQTVEPPINASGIYIIQSADGKFNKKLTIKK
jgi:hypothetical protein